MGDDEDGYPLWSRVLMATAMLAGGAGLGAAFGGSWGTALMGAILASPLALAGFFAPGVLVGLLAVLELFSCGG